MGAIFCLLINCGLSAKAQGPLQCLGGQIKPHLSQAVDLKGGDSIEDYDGYAVMPTEVGRVSFSISPTDRGYHFLIRQVITGRVFLNTFSSALPGHHEVRVHDRLSLFIKCIPLGTN